MADDTPSTEPSTTLVVHPDVSARAAIAERLGRSCDGRPGTVAPVATLAAALAQPADDVRLVVTAWRLPDGTGGELIGVLGTRPVPPVAVLLVPAHDPVDVADGIRAGVHGIATVDDLDGRFLAAAASAAEAGGLVIADRPAGAIAALAPPAARTLLSRRELEVVECLGLGLTNAEAAARLYVSRETVKTHVAQVLRKLQVGDRMAAADRARALGLLAPADPTPARPARPPGAVSVEPDHHRHDRRLVSTGTSRSRRHLTDPRKDH